MQVESHNLGKLERKLTVKIPSDRMDEQVSERMARMGKEVRLKGFRPGRVPRGVIEQRYGVQIRNEVLSQLLSDSFREAVQQEELRPAGAPEIETRGVPENGEIAYTATFEVMPELPEVDVSDFKVQRPVAEVADADIDEMIETLRQQHRTYEPVERKAAEDDLVLFEFEADTSEGRFPEADRERVGAVLGGGQFNAEIEKALAGLEAGDDFALEATFDESFKYEELAGKLCQVRGAVLRVQESELPAIDEAFFKLFGIDEGGEEGFRQEVRNNLERELEGVMKNRLKAAVAEALAEAHADLDVPRVMVLSQARAMLGLDESGTLSDEQFEQIEPAARARVIAGLLFVKIAQDQGIKVDDQRVGKLLAAIASTYEQPDQLVELYRNNQELMGGLHERVLEEQVSEWVAENAECVDQTMSFSELMQPAAQV